MITKKAQGLTITTLIVASIALIVLVVLVMIFTGRIGIFNEFNPERDVCLMTIQEAYNNAMAGTLDREEVGNRILSLEGDWESCYDYRPKNPCELNPNSEGCVCDKTCNPFIETEEKWDECKKAFDEMGELVDEVCLTGNKDTEICISAHSPSPCELEDEHYVYGGKCHGELYNSSNLCSGKPCQILCSTGWIEFCRLKTIYDYSCQELLFYISTDSKYCDYKDEWNTNCHVWKGDELHKHNLINIYKEKGCLN